MKKKFYENIITYREETAIYISDSFRFTDVVLWNLWNNSSIKIGEFIISN